MTAPITDGGTRDLETAWSAPEADDLYRQLDQWLSTSDKRLGRRGRQEGSAVLDASLGAEQLAQGLLRGGRVGAPAQGGPDSPRPYGPCPCGWHPSGR
jgi:hypothetical protein